MSRVPLSRKARFDIFRRDNFSCQYCGAHPAYSELRVDHVHPVAKGGTNEKQNLITACHPCNAGKRDYPADEVRGSRAASAVWAIVGQLPHDPYYTDEHRRRMTVDQVRAFAAHDFEGKALKIAGQRYSSWEDWRHSMNVWFLEYLAHCVGLDCQTDLHRKVKDLLIEAGVYACPGSSAEDGEVSR